MAMHYGVGGVPARPNKPRDKAKVESGVQLVERWIIAALRNHYTPTYSSWLNQVERWFGLITQRAIRRGSFSSVKDLIQKIDKFVQNYNRTHRPFEWTATADSILQKI